MEVQGKKKEVVVFCLRPPLSLFSRCSRAVTSKECTKKRDAREESFLANLNRSPLPFSFLTSPSSLLKLPILTKEGRPHAVKRDNHFNDNLRVCLKRGKREISSYSIEKPSEP